MSWLVTSLNDKYASYSVDEVAFSIFINIKIIFIDIGLASVNQ